MSVNEHRIVGNSAPIRNAMSVDVEDYFQVQAMAAHVERNTWDRRECRVERNTERVLQLFEQHDVRGTFFTLGWVAQRYPQLIRRIVEGGHELASHGFDHFRVSDQTPDEFRSDVRRTKQVLEDIGGVAISGYRAASFSIGAKTLWAHDVLADEGYTYSSSIYPIQHDLYGMPQAPRFTYQPASADFVELPMTTVTLAGRNLPAAGGGYFRLLPYGYSRWALNRVNRRERRSGIFYFHPWEIDPGQPRIAGVSAKSRFRHYTNLAHMEAKLDRLLGDFSWGRIDELFPVRRNSRIDA